MAPPYVALVDEGRIGERIAELHERMAPCRICPHRCGVDRFNDNSGRCRSGHEPVVSAFNAHFGEEKPLVGRYGSGTIFFTHCNLDCIFCQNYDISHLGRGDTVSITELAGMMLKLQDRGCHNINFVTPTHMILSIVEALEIAVPEGLNVPLVYNSGGYDSVETLELLDGIIDIYMPDFKYMDPNVSDELSGAPDYPQRAMDALREMHRQVGDLEINKRGIAERGLLVRHLVLPNNLAATDRIVAFLADLSTETYVNIMMQYHPEYRASQCFDLRRRITLGEYDEACAMAERAGLHRLDRR